MPSLAHISLLATALSGLVLAHPGHNVKEEAAERAVFLDRSTNLYAKCGKKLEIRGVEKKAAARREALAQKLRAKRSLSKRNVLRMCWVMTLFTDYIRELS